MGLEVNKRALATRQASGGGRGKKVIAIVSSVHPSSRSDSPSRGFMATPFESPKPGTAVMSLSALDAASDSTEQLTNESSATRSPGRSPTFEGGHHAPSLLPYFGPRRGPSRPRLFPREVEMVSTLKRSLAELTRYLVAHPKDGAALAAVCAALRDGGQVEELVGLLDSCTNGEQGDSLPDHAIAELFFRIAKESSDAHGRELCRAALDRYPVHVPALSLFEQLADASWTDELCARYQIFLEDAPLHGVAADICAVVTNKLVEAQREATAKHEDLDEVHRLARVFEGLRTMPEGFLARHMSEADSVSERQSTDVLSMHA